MKRFKVTEVLVLIPLLTAIAIGQGLNRRSFDTVPNATRNLEQAIDSEERKKSVNVAKPPQLIGPTCPVSGKPLRSTDPRFCSVMISVSAGPSAGRIPISLCEYELTEDTYSPHRLGSPGGSDVGPELETIFVPSGNASTPYTIRQLKSPETFIDIVPLSRWEYEIRFYHPEESVVSQAKTEKREGLKLIPGVGRPEPVGLYNVIGEPFVIWRFRNPNPPALEKLQVSQIKNGVTDTNEYHYVAATDTWTMSNNAGELIAVKTSEVNSSDPCQRTEVLVKKDRGIVVSRRSRVFRGFAWGQEIVKQVDEQNGEAKTTTYTYYQDPAEENRYRQVESVTNPDGSWEKYDYDQVRSSLVKRVIASGAPGTSKPK
jgi:hypothetical protein